MKSDHYPWLDWLRFGAAFAVLLCHARGGNWMDWGSLDESSKNGVVALFFALTRPNLEPVVVFFVLSGFLVGGKVLERLMCGAFSPASFALDRFSRIYIPLVPALALSAFAAWATGKSVSLWELTGNLLSLQSVFFRSFADNAPLWSLSYEVWFYVLAGSAAAVATASSRHRVLAMVLFVGALLVYTRLWNIFLYCWLLGAVAYPLRKVVLPWMAFVLGVLLTVGGAVASQLNMQTKSAGTAIEWLPSRDIAILVMSAGFAVAVAWLAGRPIKTTRMQRIQASGAVWAAFSYTLYLTHYPLLHLWGLVDSTRYQSVTAFSLGVLVLKLGSCLLVAWLLYLPFERRTGDFRRWFRSRFMAREGGARGQ
jgi:peptidoglycan/LPS O-acetylase OafA/YrhL